MSHDAYEELLVAEALGVLTTSERSELDAHLAAGCAVCREMRPALNDVAAALPDAPRAPAAPPALKQRILAEIEKSESNRTHPFWIKTSVWAALAAAVIAAFFVPAIVKKPVIGHLVQVSGRVSIGGAPAGEGTEVRDGQRIRLGPDSYAAIRLGDPVLVQAGPNSDLKIRRHENGFDSYLNHGSAINLVKPGTPYEMVTPVLTTEARGTGFFMNVPSPDRTYVCICVGKIDVSGTRTDFHRTMASQHHGAIWATREGDHLVTKDAGLEDHSDAQIAALLALFK
jgi:hypothetical protein